MKHKTFWVMMVFMLLVTACICNGQKTVIPFGMITLADGTAISMIETEEAPTEMHHSENQESEKTSRQKEKKKHTIARKHRATADPKSKGAAKHSKKSVAGF